MSGWVLYRKEAQTAGAVCPSNHISQRGTEGEREREGDKERERALRGTDVISEHQKNSLKWS